MERMTFEADEELLERARRRARERGISVAQVIGEALKRELPNEGPQPPLTCIGVMKGSGHDLATRVEELYEPDPWRS